MSSAKIRATARAEVRRYAADVLAPAIASAVGELIHAAEQRLEVKLAAVEAATELRFVGQWQEHKSYKAGNFASTGGQIWHCNVDSNSRPGSDNSWTLACKSGRDGRDGRDFTPPPPEQPPQPRTTTTTR